jgi:glycosyltransferase involved in cell wall biosynthesis
MRAPLVSVVIPVYNAERYLAESVRSALGQSWPEIEVLIVDDGSTDNSLRIARKLAVDPRVRLLSGGNGGPARARNLGILEARGEFIAFLDADDLWLPHKLERQIPLFSESPAPGVVYSQRLTIDAAGAALEGYRPPVLDGRILDEMWVDNFICMSSAVVRRDVFEGVGLLDESLRMSEDFDFWLRAAVHCEFRGVEEPLVKYRVHGEQASRRTEERVRVAWEIRGRFEAKYGRHLGGEARRRARARHFATRGLREERGGERWRSLVSYLRALRLEPLNEMAIRGVAKAVLPGCVSAWFRKGAAPTKAEAS